MLSHHLVSQGHLIWRLGGACSAPGFEGGGGGGGDDDGAAAANTEDSDLDDIMNRFLGD